MNVVSVKKNGFNNLKTNKIMKVNFDLKNKYPSVEFCYNNKCIMIRYWGGLKFDKVVLYGAEQFKNK
jgi:hypothetical protein